MIIEGNKIKFYGKAAGEIKNGTAYVSRKFQCGEITVDLMRRDYRIIWVD